MPQAKALTGYQRPHLGVYLGDEASVLRKRLISTAIHEVRAYLNTGPTGWYASRKSLPESEELACHMQLNGPRQP